MYNPTFGTDINELGNSKNKIENMEKKDKLKAGHYEIQGETIAKFELFEQGWNPYSRYLDIDKIDIILRKKKGDEILYREIQVKFGKLFNCGVKWENELFDITSWKFFNKDEFNDYKTSKNLFLIYVLSVDKGYSGDIFVFPIKEFSDIIDKSIVSHTKNGEKRKLYISRSNNKWYARKNEITSRKEISDETCIEVTKYRRNFQILDK